MDEHMEMIKSVTGAKDVTYSDDKQKYAVEVDDSRGTTFSIVK